MIKENGHVFSVAELTSYLKEIFAADPLLNRLRVSGEISNFKHHSSGHMYFTLKDNTSQLRCVMFRSANQRLNFRPQNGMKVVAGGRLSIYERDGQYQLYVESMLPEGVGSLYAAFLALKEKLAAEGLFDAAHKKKLPPIPKRIGLVTSPTGAAVRDILTTLKRRFPLAEVLLVPVLVQGPEAPGQIVEALELLDEVPEIDVIIVGRGGGSIEELWAFNDEMVARAIYAARIPVVSAVGHETDFTIADFVADVRAATPTAAAELVVPDRRELDVRLVNAGRRMRSTLARRLEQDRRYLEKLASSRLLTRPHERVMQLGQVVDSIAAGLESKMSYCLQGAGARLENLEGRLLALNPEAVLRRGYAICLDGRGRLIKRAKDVSGGDEIEVRLGQGALEARVNRVRGGEEVGGK